MNKFFSTLIVSAAFAALSTAASAQAPATHTTIATAPGSLEITDITLLPHEPTSKCGETTHCWENWGAAPFAQSEAEAFSDAKIDQVLADAVKQGFPSKLVAFAKNYIKTHPRDARNTVYLVPGKHLDFMESREGPMVNVTIGKISVGKGEVKAAEAYEYAFDYHDTIWVLDWPFRCWNGSMWHMGEAALPPPPPTYAPVVNEQCGKLDIFPPADSTILVEIAGAKSPKPNPRCTTAYKQAGDANFTLVTPGCEDICLRNAEADALQRGRDLTVKENGKFGDGHLRAVPTQIRFNPQVLRDGGTIMVCAITLKDGEVVTTWHHIYVDLAPNTRAEHDEIMLHPFRIDKTRD